MVIQLKIKRRDFFQRDSIPILVSCTVKTREFKLLYFRNETCYGSGNLYKDLLFVYLNASLLDDVTVKPHCCVTNHLALRVTAVKFVYNWTVSALADPQRSET